jgi:Holliday junction resolvase RusA-like endonuclease
MLTLPTPPEYEAPAGLQLVIPFLPPSSNHIYVNRPGGHGRFLSKEAEAWKNRFSQQVLAPYMAPIQSFGATIDRDPYSVLELWMAFFFPPEDLLNMTYGTGKKGAAKTFFKKMDVQNRIKLVTDAVVKAIALDDSLNFREIHDKCSNELVGGHSGVCIRLRKRDPAQFGITVKQLPLL